MSLQDDMDRLWTVTVPEYNYALEWDIVGNNAPDIVPTHQRREFLERKAFDEYEAQIREAEKEGMCENVKVFVRRIQVFPWVEGLVAP